MNILNRPLTPQDLAVDLRTLPRDLKRILRVQWKEFIHFTEDAWVEVRTKNAA